MQKNKGFTLVELLAVIVILAVILVIAVPQIMSVIESARKGSIESTAKLIAEGAEREYTNRKILGKDTNVLCSDVSSMNSNDYGSCVISFDNAGKATVKVTGKGKFEGYTCNGNSINMECVKGEIPGSTETVAQYFSYSEVEGGVAITGYNIEGGLDVVIPSEIDGKKVVAIADYAFTTNGVTPTNISNTKKVSVSYLNNNKKDVATIPLSRIPVEGLGITSVVIPSTVKSIGESAFENNQLTEVTIPSSVTSIGSYAFHSNKLTSITLLDGVANIGNSAFSSNQLTSLTLLDGITSIGNSAFYGNKLTKLTIPGSVTSIGRRAFYKDSSSNSNLSKIVNKSSKSFDWTAIVNDEFGVSSFITGTVKNSYGDVEVVSE